LEAFTHAVRLPKFPTKDFPGAHTVVDRSGAHVIVESSLEPPRRRRVLPGAFAPSFPTIIGPLYAPPSSLIRVGDAVDHAGIIPKPVTPFPGPQQRCPSRARDVVHPASFPSPRRHRPAPSLDPQRRHPPRAHNAIIPVARQSPRRH
jgi:hypothetical protein